MSKLFNSYKLGSLNLANRIVMAPMTRSRAINNVPNELMAEYYGQRASAGLIITEGTSSSLNGLGYSRIPGCYSKEQVEGWKITTKAVHDKGSKIFLQIMHCGRIAHELNLPKGGAVVGPSAIAAKGKMWTDQSQMQDMPVPKEMTAQEVKETIAEYVHASALAIEAGFDGVELHGANGYLIEQFLHPGSNKRTDDYGKNRIKFAVDVAAAVADKIKPERVGIRVSPYSTFNDIEGVYNGVDELYGNLAKELNKLNILYMHLMPGAGSENAIKQIKSNFKGVKICAGGYDLKRATADVESGNYDLIAFGRPFLGNPTLVHKLQNNLPLVEADPAYFYLPGPKGYTDYV